VKVCNLGSEIRQFYAIGQRGGYRRNSRTGNVIQQKSTLRLWEQLGWLNAKYESPELGLQWQVVLARASDPKAPEVKIESSPVPGFEVKYGSYWLRDRRGSLRMMREIKTPESPPWPAMPIDKEAKQIGITTLNFPGKMVHAIVDWRVGDWLWMSCGLHDNATGQERYDILVRLQHRDLPMRTPGNSSYMMVGASYTVDFTYAQQRGHYEADLFLATRSLASADDVARLVEEAKTKKAMTRAPSSASRRRRLSPRIGSMCRKASMVGSC
jgi:hypothetical protein